MEMLVSLHEQEVDHCILEPIGEVTETPKNQGDPLWVVCLCSEIPSETTKTYTFQNIAEKVLRPEIFRRNRKPQ